MELKFSGFDWDDGNRHKNVHKHGITPAKAEECFGNAPMVYPDTRHSSESEKRFVLFGTTNSGEELFIAFTLRDGKARVISARPLNRKERKWYEEKKKEIG